jgi:hypothetical protein
MRLIEPRAPRRTGAFPLLGVEVMSRVMPHHAPLETVIRINAGQAGCPRRETSLRQTNPLQVSDQRLPGRQRVRVELCVGASGDEPAPGEVLDVLGPIVRLGSARSGAHHPECLTGSGEQRCGPGQCTGRTCPSGGRTHLWRNDMVRPARRGSRASCPLARRPTRTACRTHA